MRELLTFQLYGVMASWGDIAVGDHRPSCTHPTKSSIMGIIAAALGIERNLEEEHLKLAERFKVSICVRSRGNFLCDYHTVILNDKKDTKVSKRDYFTDSFHQVAIWRNEPHPNISLKDIEEGLKNPRFPLYLGRKSCPIGLPLCPKIFPDTTLKSAFQKAFEQSHFKDKIGDGDKDCRCYCEPGLESGQLEGMTKQMSNVRRDEIHSRGRWQFVNRKEDCYVF